MYAKLAQRRAGYVAGQLELTSECFQKCFACDSWKQHASGQIRDQFELGEAKDLLNQLQHLPTFEHLSFTGGDPQSWEPFDHLLYWAKPIIRFSMQANTALCVDPPDFDLWRTSLRRIRVSLDGVTRETYRKARGDDRDPEEILDRAERLAHPGWQTNTCVSDVNIDEVPAIIARLSRMKTPPRKAMFLAVLDWKTAPDFWAKYSLFKDMFWPANVVTSFSEDVKAVREFTVSPEAAEIPCYTGAITFHIKCNGDVYPCCLVGGEAIKTRKEMAIGNVHRDRIEEIQSRYIPMLHYKNSNSPCRQVCQFKQLHLNRLAHEASKLVLTMP